MRNLLLSTSALALIGLTTGCSVVGGTLAGSALFGAGYSLDQDWTVSAIGGGTSVVCLGGDAELADLYEIHGRVISDTASNVDVGTLIPCAQDPMRVLVVQDESGTEYELGYAWIGPDGWNSTPAVGLQGQRVDLIVRQGEGDSAGFALHDSNGLSYAMESGIGGRALQDQDLGEIAVSEGEVVGTIDNEDCGAADSISVVFETEQDELTLYPGEDSQLMGQDNNYTTCNINSVQPDDCGAGETSWVTFR